MAAGSLVVVVGIAVQAFSIVAYVRGAGEGAFELHKANSIVVHAGQLAISIGAIWAWWRNWVVIGLAVSFAVLSVLQVMAVGDIHNEHGWIYGLHGAGAILILLIAVVTGEIAAQGLGLLRPRDAPPRP
jgi:hypothetical protein